MKKSFINLFLLTVLCAASAFAQDEPAEVKEKQIGEERYQAFCKPDFTGEPISLNIVNADIRDILGYITKEFGYVFELDSSVGRKVTSINVDNIPWNIALGNILDPEDLSMECTARAFRIKLESRKIVPVEKETEASPLYTVYIKLQKLPTCAKKRGRCIKTMQALSRLKSSVAERLSKNGQVEVEEATKTLVITDSRGNLNALVTLVDTLDNEEFYNQAVKGK